jgi:hypothetical protein
VDLPIPKTFNFTERVRAQFRGEAFNIFNYAQYNLSPFNSFPTMCHLRRFWKFELDRERTGIIPIQAEDTVLSWTELLGTDSERDCFPSKIASGL